MAEKANPQDTTPANPNNTPKGDPSHSPKPSSGDPYNLDAVTELRQDFQDLSSQIGGLVDSINQLMSGQGAGMKASKTEISQQVLSGISDEQWQEEYEANPSAAALKLINSVASNLRKEIKEEVSRETKLERDIEKWDERSFDEFPELADPSSDLRKRTIEIMNQKKVYNAKAKDDPRLQYDSAKEAYADLVRAGKIRPPTDEELKTTQREATGGGSFGGSGKKVVRINDLQKHILSQMGVSEESFLKRKQA